MLANNEGQTQSGSSRKELQNWSGREGRMSGCSPL